MEFLDNLREVERDWKAATPTEKKSDIAEFLGDIANGIVAERAGWVLNGSYGKGSYDAAWEVMRRPRMNRVAWLSQVTAALEYRLPATVARREWNKLSAAQKAKFDAAVKAEIDYALDPANH